MTGKDAPAILVAATKASSKNGENEKALEDDKSWDLYQERLKQQGTDDGRRLHYYTKDERPAIQYDTQHALMIDAGSQGTRIHVYEFEARILSTHGEIKDAVTGRRLSFPTTDTRWTNRKKPGLDVFAFVVDDEEMRNQVEFYLSPLLQFAKDVLGEKKEYWKNYPIYLKATGGLRALPGPYRLRLMKAVRSLFQDTAFNPFFFETEHARVISGEEEAIYGWAAVNFVKKTLLRNSEGTGSVLNPGRTYGVLEASCLLPASIKVCPVWRHTRSLPFCCFLLDSIDGWRQHPDCLFSAQWRCHGESFQITNRR